MRSVVGSMLDPIVSRKTRPMSKSKAKCVTRELDPTGLPDPPALFSQSDEPEHAERHHDADFQALLVLVHELARRMHHILHEVLGRRPGLPRRILLRR